MRPIFKFRDNKSKYQGEWLIAPKDRVDSKGRSFAELKDIDGRGVYIGRDGYRYDGFFKAGKRHGHGREIPTGLHSDYNWIF